MNSTRSASPAPLTAPDRLLDGAAVLALLAAEVARAGTQARWCATHGISTAYLSDVLTGRREPGGKILDRLGLERVPYYRNKSADQA